MTVLANLPLGLAVRRDQQLRLEHPDVAAALLDALAGDLRRSRPGHDQGELHLCLALQPLDLAEAEVVRGLVGDRDPERVLAGGERGARELRERAAGGVD